MAGNEPCPQNSDGSIVCEYHVTCIFKLHNGINIAFGLPGATRNEAPELFERILDGGRASTYFDIVQKRLSVTRQFLSFGVVGTIGFLVDAGVLILASNYLCLELFFSRLLSFSVAAG